MTGQHLAYSDEADDVVEYHARLDDIHSILIDDCKQQFAPRGQEELVSLEWLSEPPGFFKPGYLGHLFAAGFMGQPDYWHKGIPLWDMPTLVYWVYSHFSCQYAEKDLFRDWLKSKFGARAVARLIELSREWPERDKERQS